MYQITIKSKDNGELSIAVEGTLNPTDFASEILVIAHSMYNSGCEMFGEHTMEDLKKPMIEAICNDDVIFCPKEDSDKRLKKAQSSRSAAIRDLTCTLDEQEQEIEENIARARASVDPNDEDKCMAIDLLESLYKSAKEARRSKERDKKCAERDKQTEERINDSISELIEKLENNNWED